MATRVFCLLPFSSPARLQFLAQDIEERSPALSLQPREAKFEGLELQICAFGNCAATACPAQFVERPTDDFPRLIRRSTSGPRSS
jgi:hypothetical protein